MALTAQHFSKHGSMVGLEFWVRFRKAIFADEVIDLESIVDLRGRIRNAQGETALGAKGRVLVTEKL